MKLPLLSLPLATTLLCSATEQPDVVLTGVYLQPSVPEWAIAPDDEDESWFEESANSAHMIVNLCVRGNFLPETTKQAPTEADYAVNEEDEWDDWEDDEEENDVTLTNISFSGTLTDSRGKALHTGELNSRFTSTESNILWCSLFANELPDTMQLQLKGTLRFTAWGDKCALTEPVRLRKTAENYYWATMRGYNIILETNAPDEDDEEPEDDETDAEETEEEEAPFDVVDDDELPEPAEVSRDDKQTAVLRIEGDSELLSCVRGIEVRDENNEFVFYEAVYYTSLDDCISIKSDDLKPEYNYYLNLPTHKQDHSFEIDRTLYLNGKK